MGLKTKNYVVKKTDTPLAEAYAIIKNLEIYGNYARADFAIQASREKAQEIEPHEIIPVEFPLDRNENPFVTAYKTATKEITVKDENGNVVQIVKMPFFGWDNDIVEN